MGIFGRLLQSLRGVKFYVGAAARAAPWSKDLYEQETVRAIVDCIASNIAKAEAMHVILDEAGRVKKIVRNSPYVKLLNQQPNPLMTGFDLKYKLISQLETATTAVCFIRWENARPTAMIPLRYADLELCPIEGGGYAIRFMDQTDGQAYALHAEDLVILRKFFNGREVFGDGNAPVYNTLDMIRASDEGFMEALRVSNKVRGLLTQKNSMLAPDDVQKSTEDFVKRFEYAAKNGGVVGLDSMEQYTPLNVSAWAANSAQMREIRENLMRYWRISEPILTSNYSESQWQAFYESVIEPRLIQMGQAFTNACFTRTERDYGNRIIFSTSVLLNASMQTKVNLVQASREIGLLSRNELRELFGYGPMEGGDEHLCSLNYIKESDMTRYQTGEEGEDHVGNEEGPDDQSL